MPKKNQGGIEITEAGVRKILSKIKHPEITKHDVVTLGMIPEIQVEADRIGVKLAFPFPEVPIAEQLRAQVRNALQGALKGVRIDVETTQMAPRQRASFTAMARGERPSSASRENVAQVLAVMSGKGGVGKSSIAGLLASSLRRRGLRIGILDADITGPSIPKIFGIHQAPIAGPQGIKPVPSSTGIEVMSINLLLPDEDQPVVWRGPLIAKAIEQFWKDIAWSQLDFLIIDLPPGTSDAALTVMQSLPLDGIVLVTSPQDLAGMVVRKAANMAKRLGIKLLGVVENMSHVVCPECETKIEIFGSSQAEATAERIGTRLLGRMPLALNLSTLCDRGEIEQFHSEVLDSLTDEVLAGVDSNEEPSA
ncbi:MAG TPA: Mrp/NBP35 family ATP-binding protein [Anaerolineae bacterium]|nr:Mrp/NBP35 family ATP-binding protein [Anaerolineae bacterium]